MAKTTKKSGKGKTVTIPAIKLKMMTIKVRNIEGSSYISGRFSPEKFKKMLDTQMKKAKGAKEPRDPEADFKGSLYPMPNGKGYGIPAIAFKKAMVGACRYTDGMTMAKASGAFFVMGDLLPIHGSDPIMRADTVKNANGGTDIRFRGEFRQWDVMIPIRLNPNVISDEQIVNLLAHAGFHVGVGERRPERSGDQFGQFEIVTK